MHVGVLALARAHADSGVALQQLDVVEALLHGIEEVLELQVLIEVDEVLAARMRKDRIGMARSAALRLCDRRRERAQTNVGGGLQTRALAVTQLLVQVVDTVMQTSHGPAGACAGTNCSRVRS